MFAGCLAGMVFLPSVSYILYWRNPPQIPGWNVEEFRSFVLWNLGVMGCVLGAITGWSATSLPQNNARAGWTCIGCGVLFSFLLLISVEDIQKFDLPFWIARAGIPLLWSLLLVIRGIYVVMLPDNELDNEVEVQ